MTFRIRRHYRLGRICHAVQMVQSIPQIDAENPSPPETRTPSWHETGDQAGKHRAAESRLPCPSKKGYVAAPLEPCSLTTNSLPDQNPRALPAFGLHSDFVIPSSFTREPIRTSKGSSGLLCESVPHPCGTLAERNARLGEVRLTLPHSSFELRHSFGFRASSFVIHPRADQCLTLLLEMNSSRFSRRQKGDH